LLPFSCQLKVGGAAEDEDDSVRSSAILNVQINAQERFAGQRYDVRGNVTVLARSEKLLRKNRYMFNI